MISAKMASPNLKITVSWNYGYDVIIHVGDSNYIVYVFMLPMSII